MKPKKSPDRRLAGNVNEFARLALELAALDPAALHALGEEMLAESKQGAPDRSLVPNKKG